MGGEQMPSSHKSSLYNFATDYWKCSLFLNVQPTFSRYIDFCGMHVTLDIPS